MPRMCCVGSCDSNYRKEEQCTKVFRFPSDSHEKQRWLDQLPNVVSEVTADSVVCEKHWPCGYETLRKKGRLRPVHPPTVFELPASFHFICFFLIHYHQELIFWVCFRPNGGWGRTETDSSM